MLGEPPRRRLDPQPSTHHISRGSDPAIAPFGAVLRQRSEDANAHFNLGETFALQGKTEEPAAHPAEALRLRPGWDQARRELDTLRQRAVKP